MLVYSYTASSQSGLLSSGRHPFYLVVFVASVRNCARPVAHRHLTTSRSTDYSNTAIPSKPHPPLYHIYSPSTFLISKWENGEFSGLFLRYILNDLWSALHSRTPNYVDDVLHSKISSLVYAQPRQ